MELVAEPVWIRNFNNPAEIVRICENIKECIVYLLRSGADELYTMDYQVYQTRVVFVTR